MTALSIILENPSSEFEPGQTIRGKIHVKVTKKTKCQSLIVEFGSHTSGGLQQEHGQIGSKLLFNGTWLPGDFEYTFELRLPDEMLPSYSGVKISLAWILRARASIPFFDAKVEHYVNILPSKNPSPKPVKALTNTFSLSSLFSSSAISRYKIDVPDLVAPGEIISPTFFFIPNVDIEVSQIILSMHSFEIRTRRDHNHQRYFDSYELGARHIFLAGKSSYSAGHTAMLKSQLLIPEKAPQTYSTNQTGIYGEYRIRVVMNGRDWHRTLPFNVLPGYKSGRESAEHAVNEMINPYTKMLETLRSVE